MNRERILVVDDRSDWLETIDLLLGHKYDLSSTSQPSEAISLMRSSFFSLAILDQRISPEVSGVVLLKELRGIQPDIQAIILTEFADVEDAVKSMKIGVCDYISKRMPNLESELLSRVESALARSTDGTTLLEMIKEGESAELEFKSSARWDLRQNKVNKDLENVIVKTVAAFLNSERGGILLIGVDDSGKVLGLQHDYKTLKKQDRDGFEAFLVTLLLGAYGKDVSLLLRIDFLSHEGHEVCRVSARPAPKPVYAPDGNGGEHLYIRTGNSTRQLSTREAIDYSKTRWQ